MAKCVAFDLLKYYKLFGGHRKIKRFNDLCLIYTKEIARQQSRLRQCDRKAITESVSVYCTFKNIWVNDTFDFFCSN